MKSKLFNNLLLFSLFGVALGFFGILYEGLVYGPKFLDVYMERMLFWKGFTSTLSPIIFYIPWDPLATIVLVVLYFIAPKQNEMLKKQLGWASILQGASLVLTFYILTQIDFKQSFGNLDKYAVEIPGKVILFNVLSIVRIVFAGIALAISFKAYIKTQTIAELRVQNIA